MASIDLRQQSEKKIIAYLPISLATKPALFYLCIARENPMARPTIPATGIERTFDPSEIIVSKTDLTGVITYANDVFCRVAGYDESQLLGQQHNIVRHRDMPRCIFKFLWDTISNGDEVFAYVINQAKNGDHYWVFAHVTPSFNANGDIISYHSMRRVPDEKPREIVAGLYKQLKEVESSHANPKDGMEAALNVVVELLQENKMDYNEFIFSLFKA